MRPTTFSTYRKQIRLIEAELGTITTRELRPERVAAFVPDLIDRGSPSRARNVRTLLVQIMDQGWRISEALGLAWKDIDIESRTVRLRRGSTYTDGVGMVLGPTKTRRTAGSQSLSPTVIAVLAKRREVQDEERSSAETGRSPTTTASRSTSTTSLASSATPTRRRLTATCSTKAIGHARSASEPSNSSTRTGLASRTTLEQEPRRASDMDHRRLGIMPDHERVSALAG